MVAKRTASQEAYEEPMGEEIAPNAFLLTVEESWILLGRRTQDYLSMSAEEFVQRLKTNDFTEEQREVASMLSMMVPYGFR